MLRSLETLSRRSNKILWRRTTVSFETYLRRRWDVQRDVVTTSLRRLVAGWDTFNFFLLLVNYLAPGLLENVVRIT